MSKNRFVFKLCFESYRIFQYENYYCIRSLLNLYSFTLASAHTHKHTHSHNHTATTHRELYMEIIVFSQLNEFFNYFFVFLYLLAVAAFRLPPYAFLGSVLKKIPSEAKTEESKLACKKRAENGKKTKPLVLNGRLVDDRPRKKPKELDS